MLTAVRTLQLASSDTGCDHGSNAEQRDDEKDDAMAGFVAKKQRLGSAWQEMAAWRWESNLSLSLFFFLYVQIWWLAGLVRIKLRFRCEVRFRPSGKKNGSKIDHRRQTLLFLLLFRHHFRLFALQSTSIMGDAELEEVCQSLSRHSYHHCG